MHSVYLSQMAHRPESASWRQALLMSGVVAPVVYLGTMILGGWIQPGYSHMANSISELTATGAPNQALLIPLFSLYNALGALFGVGLLLLALRAAGTHRSLGVAGPLLLGLTALLGLAMLIFRQDPGGPPVTFIGTMHVILAGLASFSSMGATLLLGLYLRRIPGMRRYGMFSLVMVGIIFVSGGLTAGSIGSGQNEYIGALERITIGGYLLWMLVVARAFYRLPQARVEPRA